MTDQPPIPVVGLFGETDSFPDVVHCERIRTRAGLHDWTISPHRHDQMAQVFHMESGRARVRIDGTETELLPGNFLYIPTRIVHGFAFSKGTEGLVLSFPLPVVTGVTPYTADLAQRLSRPIIGPVDAQMSALLSHCADASESTGTFRVQGLIALSHAILAAVAETGDAQAHDGPAHDTLTKFAALLATHIGDGWRPRDYAGALSITTGHLNRICRDTAGTSVSTFIERAVMTEACRLLAFTRLPVAEVAYRLGYTDPPYFSRRFRIVRGQTPSAYRARFLSLGT